jgi:WD40 repeat protein
VLTGHIDPVTGLAMTPDGNMLVSAAADWTVRIWDVATGQVRTAIRTDSPTRRCCWVTNTHFICTGGESGVVHAFRLVTD